MSMVPMAQLRRIARECAKSARGRVVISMPHEKENARLLEQAGLIELEAMEMCPGYWVATMTPAGSEALIQKEYNADDDFAKSLDEAYRAIRERVAAGGKPWRPK